MDREEAAYEALEAKMAADLDAWLRFGPKCATCKHGFNFNAAHYPDSLIKDVTYCNEFNELMEDVDEPNEELFDCWESY